MSADTLRDKTIDECINKLTLFINSNMSYKSAITVLKELKSDNDKQHGYCLMCGRKLKTDETKARGYGNVCWKRLQARKNKSLF